MDWDRDRHTHTHTHTMGRGRGRCLPSAHHPQLAQAQYLRLEQYRLRYRQHLRHRPRNRPPIRRCPPRDFHHRQNPGICRRRPGALWFQLGTQNRCPYVRCPTSSIGCGGLAVVVVMRYLDQGCLRSATRTNPMCFACFLSCSGMVGYIQTIRRVARNLHE